MIVLGKGLGIGTRRRLAGVIAVLAILPYLNGLQGDFCFDDPEVIRDNPMVTAPTASAMGLIKTTSYLGKPLYRPVTMLSYFANARLSASPVGYHVVNVFLHMLVSLAVWKLAWVFLGSAVGATAAAALFAVHPIHTEAVTNIVGRAELFAALFAVVSLLASVRAAQERGRNAAAWLAISLLALAVGMLAKENVFTAIPVSVIAYLWVKPTRSVREVATLVLPFALLAIAYLAMRMLLAGSLTLAAQPDLQDNPLAHVPLAPRLETALVVLWQYLSLLALPLRLSADYSFNAVPVVGSALDPRFLAATALFVLLALLIGLNVRRAPVLALAAMLVAVPLALTANILFPIGTIKAERLLYLPSFGWCLACGWLIAQSSHRGHDWWLVVVTLLVVGYAGRTWVRNRDWQNNLTLFAATVQTSPRSAKAHYNLAKAYEDRGQIDAAMQYFRETITIYPPDAEAAFGVGRIYDKKGLYNDALEWYERATDLNWHLADAHLNMGAIHYRRGELAPAETEFRNGLESEPNNPRLLIGLSLVLAAQGNQLQARAYFDRVESVAHTDPAVPRLLAQARQVLEQQAAR